MYFMRLGFTRRLFKKHIFKGWEEKNDGRSIVCQNYYVYTTMGLLLTKIWSFFLYLIELGNKLESKKNNVWYSLASSYCTSSRVVLSSESFKTLYQTVLGMLNVYKLQIPSWVVGTIAILFTCLCQVRHILENKDGRPTSEIALFRGSKRRTYYTHIIFVWTVGEDYTQTHRVPTQVIRSYGVHTSHRHAVRTFVERLTGTAQTGGGNTVTGMLFSVIEDININ